MKSSITFTYGTTTPRPTDVNVLGASLPEGPVTLYFTDAKTGDTQSLSLTSEDARELADMLNETASHVENRQRRSCNQGRNRGSYKRSFKGAFKMIRGTGKTTVRALQALAQAVQNPGEWVVLRDPYKGRRADRYLADMVKDMGTALKLDLEYSKSPQGNYRIKSHHFGYAEDETGKLDRISTK